MLHIRGIFYIFPQLNPFHLHNYMINNHLSSLSMCLCVKKESILCPKYIEKFQDLADLAAIWISDHPYIEKISVF